MDDLEKTSDAPAQVLDDEAPRLDGLADEELDQIASGSAAATRAVSRRGPLGGYLPNHNRAIATI